MYDDDNSGMIDQNEMANVMMVSFFWRRSSVTVIWKQPHLVILLIIKSELKLEHL